MFKKHMLLRFHLLCTMENLLFENFQFFDLIFEGRATFKGMKHVKQRKQSLRAVPNYSLGQELQF